MTTYRLGARRLDVIAASRALLDRIDNITTEEFSRGGEREQRERLRKALEALDDAERSYIPSTVDFYVKPR